MFIESMLKQTITTIYSVEIDMYGDPTKTVRYQNVPCRFESKFEKIINSKGDEVVSRCQVWVPPSIDASNVEIDLSDIILYNNQEYRIIAIQDGVDYDGTLRFLKLYLV